MNEEVANDLKEEIETKVPIEGGENEKQGDEPRRTPERPRTSWPLVL